MIERFAAKKAKREAAEQRSPARNEREHRVFPETTGSMA